MNLNYNINFLKYYLHERNIYIMQYIQAKILTFMNKLKIFKLVYSNVNFLETRSPLHN